MVGATDKTLAIQATPIPGNWRANYYNNKDLQNPVVLSRNEPIQTLNSLFLLNNWGTGSPSSVVNSNNFSARWLLNADFNASNFLFYAFSDDGIRVYVDDGSVIDQWTNASNRVLFGNRSLSSGQHQVRVEYFEAEGDARIAVGWQQAVENAWIGEYYANRSFGQPPLYIRQDNAINFTWGTGSPSALPSDNFSIRWFRNYDFGSSATYRFTVNVDDGVKIKVGNETIMDLTSPQTFSVNKQLSGTQKVTIEYYESTGDAFIELLIERIDSPTPNATATSAAATATAGAATATANAGGTATSAAETATAAATP